MRFRWVRAHPEIALAIAGVVVFAGGVTMMLTRSPEDQPPTSRPQSTFRQPDNTPLLEKDLEEYIANRKEHLRERSSLAPNQTSTAVVSFTDYLSADDVVRMLRNSNLQASIVHVRLPFDVFDPASMAIDNTNIAKTVNETFGPSRTAELEGELRELRSLLRDVDDPKFAAIYRQDAESHEKAIALLKKPSPTVIFGLTIEGKLSAIGKFASSKKIRVADLVTGPFGPTPILPKRTSFPTATP